MILVSYIFHKSVFAKICKNAIQSATTCIYHSQNLVHLYFRIMLQSHINGLMHERRESPARGRLTTSAFCQIITLSVCYRENKFGFILNFNYRTILSSVPNKSKAAYVRLHESSLPDRTNWQLRSKSISLNSPHG